MVELLIKCVLELSGALTLLRQYICSKLLELIKSLRSSTKDSQKTKIPKREFRSSALLLCFSEFFNLDLDQIIIQLFKVTCKMGGHSTLMKKSPNDQVKATYLSCWTNSHL